MGKIEDVLVIKDEASAAFRSATVEAKKLEEQLENVKGAGETMSTSLRSTAASADVASKATSMNRAQILSLKDAVFDFTNTLVAGGNPFTALAQQGPQVLEVISSIDGGFSGLAAAAKAKLLPALASVGPAIGYLALAAATVGTAYIAWENATTDVTSEQIDLAEQASKVASEAKIQGEAAEKLAASWAKFTDISDEVQASLDVINGKIGEGTAAAQKQMKAAEEAAEETLRAKGREVGALQTALQAQQAVYDNEAAGAEARANASAAIVKMSADLEKATTELQAHKTALAETKEGIQEIAEYKDAEAASTEFLRQREEAATETKKKATEQRQREAKEEAALQKVMATARAQRIAAEGTLQSLILSTATAEEKVVIAYQADQKAIRDAIDAGVDLQVIIDAKSAAQEKYVEGMKAAKAAREELTQAEADATTQAKDAEAASAVSATTAGITGGPQAGVDALSNAGPWGELVAGIAGMITTLGDTTDEQGNVTEGTLSEFQGYHEGLMDAIANLPRTLADNMGSIFSDSFATIIPDFIDSFTDAFPELIGGMVGGFVGSLANLFVSLLIELPIALVKGFLAMFTADFWIGIGEAIADAFAGIFSGTPEDPLAGTSTSGDVSGMGGSSRSRSGDDVYEGAHARTGYASGGYIPRTGTYLMHAGERVTPSSGASTGTGEAMESRSGGGRAFVHGGGGRLTLEIDPDSFFRTLREMGGRGFSTT